MFKHICLYTALATVVTFGSSHAQTIKNQDSIPVTWITERSTPQSRSDSARPTQALLTGIVTWLSTHFELPTIHDHPSVLFVSAERLATLRYAGLLSRQSNEIGANNAAAQASQLHDVVAVYNDKTKTVYLADTWTGTNAKELSVLVHEMVHHLQNLGDLKYECAAAREKPAYIAQEAWLNRYGLDLEQEFEIDKFTLFIKSSCMF